MKWIEINDINYHSLYYNEILQKEIVQTTRNKFITQIIMTDQDSKDENDSEDIERIVGDTLV